MSFENVKNTINFARLNKQQMHEDTKYTNCTKTFTKMYKVAVK
jgi:hypothetical protein